MNDFEQQVLESLTRLQTQMETLVGGEQPGFVQKTDSRLQILERESVLRTGEKRGWKDLGAIILSLVTAIGTFFHIFGHTK